MSYPSLNELGYEKFIEATFNIVPRPANRFLSSACGPRETLQYETLIALISKYTDHVHLHPVKLDATIEPNHPFEEEDEDNLHQIIVIGIRDMGIRKGGRAEYLPPNQKGIWESYLEDLILYGVPYTEVIRLRHRLNLTPEKGISDAEFFKHPSDDFPCD